MHTKNQVFAPTWRDLIWFILNVYSLRNWCYFVANLIPASSQVFQKNSWNLLLGDFWCFCFEKERKVSNKDEPERLWTNNKNPIRFCEVDYRVCIFSAYEDQEPTMNLFHIKISNDCIACYTLQSCSYWIWSSDKSQEVKTPHVWNLSHDSHSCETCYDTDRLRFEMKNGLICVDLYRIWWFMMRVISWFQDKLYNVFV